MPGFALQLQRFLDRGDGAIGGALPVQDQTEHRDQARFEGAIVRISRSALAWLPVHRGTGLFRMVWAAVLVGSFVVICGVMLVVLTA